MNQLKHIPGTVPIYDKLWENHNLAPTQALKHQLLCQPHDQNPTNGNYITITTQQRSFLFK